MNIEFLLQNVTTLITTPRDVAKLRQMILTLAVQGKLVPQEAGEEPVEVLLRKMNIKPLSTATTYPIPLPYNWAWISPSQLGKISGGMTPSKAKTDYWSQGTINWYSSKDIKSDELYESELKISESAYQNTGLKLYPPGCLIFVTRSGILKHTFPVSINRTPATVNQDLKVLHPTISGMERYLQIMFKGLNNFIISDLVKTGMTVQSLMFDEFCTQPFPLPPLAEQRRIVARVDELMAICDTLEAQLQARAHMQARVVQAALARVQADPSPASIATLLDPKIGASPADLRQTILTLAVQGKLVPQEAGDEPVEVLTNYDLSEQYPLPYQWKWTTITHLSPEFQNGASSRGDANGINVIVLRLADIINKRISLKDIRRIPINHKDIEKYKIQVGDILITRVNGSADIVGNFNLINTDVNAIYCDHFIRMRLPQEIVIPQYIALVGETPLIREQIKRLFVSTAGQKTINQSHISSLHIPLPPLAEQRRIVARVDELMALVDRLEAQQTKASALGAQVLDALVGQSS